jgi:aminopeptidase
VPKLDRLAEVAVKVGLERSASQGQDLVMTAPVAALPLVRRIAEHAYKAGAGLVTPILSDEEMTLARFRNGPTRASTAPPAGSTRAWPRRFAGQRGAARHCRRQPDAAVGEDPAKVARANKANSIAYQPALEKIAGFDINWNIVAYPGRWAKQVFPNDAEDDGGGKLADAIFGSRVDRADPVAEWEGAQRGAAEAHDLAQRPALPRAAFQGPGTDLTVGLADGHEWQGGASTAKNGIVCNPNIPTEEVFTTPHALRVEGMCALDQAAVHQGTLIDNIEVRFEAAASSRRKPRRGEDVLNKVLETDEGARGWAKWRWCRIPRRSRRAGCCSTTRCSTRTPPATSRSASAIRSASSTAPTLTPEQIASARAATRASSTSTG